MLFERRIFFAFFAILTTVLTLLYLFRLFSHVFMGESNGSVRMEKSCSGQMIFPVVIMSAISVLLGLVFLMNETVAWN
jgi:NADH:ubiquinone oxidoreductase subunit 5 (subunit L)/multisubunit Na+/H+ antiporter MnhA subunit